MYSKLESLRGLAACMVVLFHSVFTFHGNTSIQFIENSYLFVDLFFLISGFVMSHAYADKIINGLQFKPFILLRLGRIYPLHLFMLFAFVLYTGLKVFMYSIGFGGEQEFDQNNLYSFFSSLFLVNSIGLHDYLSWNYASWSISAEFFAYIVFFILMKSIDKNKSLIVPAIIFVSSYYFLSRLGKDDLDFSFDFGYIRCIAGFYLGVFLYRLKPKLNKLKYNVNIAEALSFVLVCYLVSIAHLGFSYHLLSVASFWVALHVFSDERNGVIGSILNSVYLRAIGVWSYSIYMIHLLFISFFDSLLKYVIKVDPQSINGLSSVFVNILIFAVVISLSRLSYIHIEDRCRKLVKSRVNNNTHANK